MRHASLLFAMALILLPRGMSAGMSCADALMQAQKSYDAGNLSEAMGYLKGGCTGAKLSRTLAIQVQSLLARALIYDERPEEARKEVSKLLRLEPTFDPGPSGRFAALVEKVRREEQATQVTSVSKTSESLREAPATVVVVTGEEIERRGYLDLEQLLHDLPGFDVSRINGDIYSNIYQRGYYNEFNDRLLLLVDGVEQNDLTQGTVYLSRQYPLTNIAQVEVIYGPASTMYGANAYTGVISVVTKDAAALVGENRRLGVTGHVTAGGYGSSAVDVTAAGIGADGNVAWSVAGRFQNSKERDLSRFYAWDYPYGNPDYKKLMHLEGTADQRSKLCTVPSSYIQCTDNGIDLTPEGERFVREADRSIIVGFDDRAKNWGLNAKLRISNLTLGLQSWRSQEGIASSQGAQYFDGNTSFTPEETAIYLKYSVRLATGTLNVFSRYLQSSIDRKASAFDYLAMYANGTLDIESLSPTTCSTCPESSFKERLVNGGLSTQSRNEVSLDFQPSEKFSGVTGLEFVKSSIQSQYDQLLTASNDRLEKFEIISKHTEHTDLALWGQGSWRPRRSLRFILAGRAGYNQINNKPGVAGFGFIFTPRLAVIYAPASRPLVLKAIYSEAFKDPTDTEKFGEAIFNRAVSGDLANPALRPERVRNLEVSAGWELNERAAIEASAYQAHYSNVVALGPAPNICGACLQEQNSDDVRIRGFEARGRYKFAATEIWANYTHTQPVRRALSLINPAHIEVVRVANVAANQVNVGVDANWRRLTATLRSHYSGRRKLGPGTTFAYYPVRPYPPYPDKQIDPYSTTAASLSYRDVLPNLTMQVLVDNLFDRNYWAAGSIWLPPVLQAGRTLNLRLIYWLKQRPGGPASPASNLP